MVHVTDDPNKIREIKARYFEAGTEFHLVPVLEFPEEGIEEMFLDNLCVDILASGNRVIICSMEFAEQLERMKKRMDEIGEVLSEAVRAAGCTVGQLAESLKIVAKTGCDTPKFPDDLGTRAAEAGRKLRAECSKIGFDYDDAVLIEKNRVREGVH